MAKSAKKRSSRWSRRFRAKPGNACRLAQIDPDATPGVKHRDDAEAALGQLTARLSELQQTLYADARFAVLVVVQAMDTGGKDGLIRKVFGPLNPQGVQVTNFKTPTGEELAHDYLWRIHRAVPRRGMVGIFNRSHYEDVLIARVHGLAPREVIEQRYEQINAFEKHLYENAVVILKFFLHISKDEQKERLESRLARPEKHWKFDPADLTERKLWPRYQRAYQLAIERCSTNWAPWHIIPANHKWYRNIAAAHTVVEHLEALDLRCPDAEPGLDRIVIKD